MAEKWSLPLPMRLLRLATDRLKPPRLIATAATVAETHRRLHDPWRGRASLAKRLMESDTDPDPRSAYYMRFHWLRDLREFGGIDARNASRRLLMGWIDAHPNWNEDACHPEIMAARLKIMVFLWGWYGETATPAMQEAMLRSIARQHLWLKRDIGKIKDGTAKSAALAALMLAGLFHDTRPDITRDARAFTDLAASQILADGCHISRRPDRHLALLRAVIESRSAIAASEAAGNAALTGIRNRLENIIAAQGGILRMWQHGDGTLFKIKGAGGVGRDAVRQVLKYVDVKGRATRHADAAGFLRLTSGRSILLLNGAPPMETVEAAAQTAPDIAHDAGALAIEFSHGKQRIIINGGAIDDEGDTIDAEIAPAAPPPQLVRALASTAAHSTLTLDDTNAASTGDDTGRPAIGSDMEEGPAEGGHKAIASHDGYEASHSVIHTRLVFLATGGKELRGEDTLTYTGGAATLPAKAILHFHLHPAAQAILGMGGDVSIAFAGGGGASASAWVFRARAAGGAGKAEVGLADSMVMENETPTRTRAITVRPDTASLRDAGRLTIRWRLQKRDK